MPGLRREELAAVAGVSAGYYARLEQGRQVTASPSVLDALARGLRLTADERRHLYTLAGTADTRSVAGLPQQVADPRVRRIVDVFGDTPAVLCRPYTDVLLVNAAASFLLTDFSSLPARDRYAMKWHLFAPETRELYGDEWEGVTVEMIGMLRLQSARHPGDPRMRDLVAELAAQPALPPAMGRAPRFGRAARQEGAQPPLRRQGGSIDRDVDLAGSPGEHALPVDS